MDNKLINQNYGISSDGIQPSCGAQLQPTATSAEMTFSGWPVSGFLMNTRRFVSNWLQLLPFPLQLSLWQDLQRISLTANETIPIRCSLSTVLSSTVKGQTVSGCRPSSCNSSTAKTCRGFVPFTWWFSVVCTTRQLTAETQMAIKKKRIAVMEVKSSSVTESNSKQLLRV